MDWKLTSRRPLQETKHSEETNAKRRNYRIRLAAKWDPNSRLHLLDLPGCAKIHASDSSASMFRTAISDGRQPLPPRCSRLASNAKIVQPQLDW